MNTSPMSPEETSRTIYAFRRNLVLAASAGTGKTHALVGVAVHLLLGACAGSEPDGGLRPAMPPDRLVATTFSRRAASEIRARLREELERLALCDPRAIYRRDLDEACLHAGVAPLSDVELALRAREALRGLGGAKIGTLHGFAASIARRHALVLGLSPDFDLPDEETTRERAAGAIELILEQRAGDPDVAALIQLSGGSPSLVELVRRLLARIADDGRTAAETVLAEDDAAQVDALLHEVLVRTRDVVGDPRLGEAASAVVAAHANGAADSVALEDAMGSLWSVPAAGKLSAAAEAFFELRDDIAHTSSGAKLRDRGRALVRRWAVRDRMLPRARALKDLLVACEEEIAKDNAQDSVLGFADILRAARDVLRDHPDIARETGAELSAMLVDEFQDTSAVQRDLVHLLWEKPRADGELRAPGVVPAVGDLRGEGLLVVGDRKQSIYGFRGADVAVFAELCVGLAGVAARDALAIPPGMVWEPVVPSADFVPLRHNWRAAAELLDFANAYSRLSLVTASTAAELYEVSYVQETEDLLSPDHAARPDAVRTPRTRWLRLAVPANKKSTSLLREAEAMTNRIATLVRGGGLAVRGAPARWKDIAILAPRHEVLSAAAYTLAQAGIPHVVAGMGFFGAREVRDVVAMLGCLVDPDDSLSRAEVLRGPWAGVSDRTLIGLTEPHAGIVDVARWGIGERRHLVDAGDREPIRALADVISTLRLVIGRIGPGAALREASRALQLEEVLVLLPRGEQRVANVLKVLALADEATDAMELLRRLRRADAREQREGEAATFSDEDDAVRLLTVHASKGLAFPIVFLPDAGAVATSRPTDVALVQTGALGASTSCRLVLRIQDDLGTVHDTPSYLAVKRDLAKRDAAERRRLRYVAITRASEALFFVGDHALPKGSRDAYETSAASLLARLSADVASRQTALLEVESGESLDPVAAGHVSPAVERSSAHHHLPFASLHEGPVTIRAEAIHDAAHCTRRYQLGEAGPADARSLADVSTALARAGAWGSRFALERPRLEQRRVVVLPLHDVRVVAEVAVTVSWDDGTLDLLCFVAPSPEAGRDDLYGAIVAHAAHTTSPSDAVTRVGLLAPEPVDGVEPRWTEPRDLAWTTAATLEVALRILSQRSSQLAPRVAEALCQSIGCSHVGGCYPARDEASARTGRLSPQTAFEFFETELRAAPLRVKRSRRRAR